VNLIDLVISKDETQLGKELVTVAGSVAVLMALPNRITPGPIPGQRT